MHVAIRIVEPAFWPAEAADVVLRTLAEMPNAVVSFPTGHTPLPLYAELRRRADRGEMDAARLRTVMLDDYLDADNAARTFHSWLRRELFDPLGVAEDRLLRIPTRSEDIEAACARFEQELTGWGGCELQLLGLGANGHIGFNEPGAAADSRTRAVTLSRETALSNAEYWDGDFLPRRAVTMGIGTILAARHICLLVRGGEKAAILRRVLQDPPDAAVPASFLQGAQHLLVIADSDAASELVIEPAGPSDGVI